MYFNTHEIIYKYTDEIIYKYTDEIIYKYVPKNNEREHNCLNGVQ